MKASSLDETGKADAVWKSNGNVVQEYNNSIAADGALYTWVPVKSGQKISLEASCTVCATEIQFDLIVDRVLRHTNKTVRNKASTSNERKKVKFSTAFMSGLDQPCEADMVVKDLAPGTLPTLKVDGTDTVGCVEIRIYAHRHEDQERHVQPIETFDHRVNGKHEDHKPTYTKIQPTQEIHLVPCNEQPSKQKTGYVTRPMHSRRAGSQPWIVFRFFYRTQDAINEAAMVKHSVKEGFRWSPPPIVLSSVESMERELGTTKPVAPETDRESDDENEDEIGSTSTSQGRQSSIAGLLAAAKVTRLEPGKADVRIASHHKSSTNPSKIQTSPLQYNKTPLASKKNDSVLEADEMDNVQQTHLQGPILDCCEADRSTPFQCATSVNDDLSRNPRQVAVVIDSKKKGEFIHNAASTGKGFTSPLFVSNQDEPIPAALKNNCLVETLDEIKDLGRAQTPVTSTQIITALPVTPTKTLPTWPITPVAPAPTIKTPSSRAVTPTPNTTSVKRKAHMTPDTANKKFKEDNDAMQRLLLEKRKQLAASREARIKAQQMAATAEAKRKADLQRMMEELELELEAESEMLKAAEDDLSETVEAANTANREHSIMD